MEKVAGLPVCTKDNAKVQTQQVAISWTVLILLLVVKFML